MVLSSKLHFALSRLRSYQRNRLKLDIKLKNLQRSLARLKPDAKHGLATSPLALPRIFFQASNENDKKRSQSSFRHHRVNTTNIESLTSSFDISILTNSTRLQTHIHAIKAWVEKGNPLLALLGENTQGASTLWDAWIETARKLENLNTSIDAPLKAHIQVASNMPLETPKTQKQERPGSLSVRRILEGYDTPVGVVGVWVPGGKDDDGGRSRVNQGEAKEEGKKTDKYVMCRADDMNSLDALQRAVQASKGIAAQIRMEARRLLEKVRGTKSMSGVAVIT